MALERTETLTLRVSQCDAAGRWKPSAILAEMQEMGEAHAASLGFPRDFLVRSNMCWVLYGLKLRLDEHPMLHDELRITTWAGTLQSLFFPRFFRFERPDGALIGEAATSWVLFNLETRRLLRPSALPGRLPANERRQCGLPLPGALHLETPPMRCERTIAYSDLDLNGHMNNTHYADWIVDLLDVERLRARGLYSLQINYNAEGMLGERIALGSVAEGDCVRVLGVKPDGRHMFEAEAVYASESGPEQLGLYP